MQYLVEIEARVYHTSQDSRFTPKCVIIYYNLNFMHEKKIFSVLSVAFPTW